MSKECTTHHFACDCREEKFKELEQENAALREDKERLDWLMSKGDAWAYRHMSAANMLTRKAIDAARKEAQP